MATVELTKFGGSNSAVGKRNKIVQTIFEVVAKQI